MFCLWGMCEVDCQPMHSCLNGVPTGSDQKKETSMKHWLKENRGFMVFLFCFGFFRLAIVDLDKL